MAFLALVGPGDARLDDRKGDDRAINDIAVNDRAGDDRAGDDRAVDDRAGDDRAGDDRTGDDRAGDDRAGDDRASDEGAQNSCSWHEDLPSIITAPSPCPRGQRRCYGARIATACADGSACFSTWMTCDGHVDCADGSDENAVACTGKTPLQDGAGEEVGEAEGAGEVEGEGEGEGGAEETSDTDGNLSETQNEPATCPPGFISCPSSPFSSPSSSSAFSCVKGALCDGINDCPLEADPLASSSALSSSSAASPMLPYSIDEHPLFCSFFICPPGYRKCLNGYVCVSEKLWCDGVNDCPSVDLVTGKYMSVRVAAKAMTAVLEAAAAARTAGFAAGSASTASHGAAYKGATPAAYTEDENPSMCAKHVCAEGTVRCAVNSKCLDATRWCDGIIDCPVTKKGNVTMKAGLSSSSSSGKGSAVAAVVTGEDEDPGVCASWSCPDWGRKCSNGVQCVARDHWCDGVSDCLPAPSSSPPSLPPAAAAAAAAAVPAPSASSASTSREAFNDEDPAMCAALVCPEGQRRCRNGWQCLAERRWCDGSSDCIHPDPASNSNDSNSKGGSNSDSSTSSDKPVPGDEDPVFCRSFRCPTGMGKCRTGLQCVPLIQGGGIDASKCQGAGADSVDPQDAGSNSDSPFDPGNGAADPGSQEMGGKKRGKGKGKGGGGAKGGAGGGGGGGGEGGGGGGKSGGGALKKAADAVMKGLKGLGGSGKGKKGKGKGKKG
ncbi:unnamed protein product [Closterium sp. NIES-64]|nr:unnamed protein product [Closterium sp. NIES-64]